ACLRDRRWPRPRPEQARGVPPAQRRAGARARRPLPGPRRRARGARGHVGARAPGHHGVPGPRGGARLVRLAGVRRAARPAPGQRGDRHGAGRRRRL
ncbi:MAG: hypothetical protein AVDCRST_MAG38-1298, partial [uncultured Solirubrobacteraceae bacterium]